MISFRSENYMYSYNKMKPKMFSTHLHDYYEFLLFAGGNAAYIVEGREYSASAGDLFITRPGELHSIIFRSDELYERYFIQIAPSLLQGAEKELLEPINTLAFGTGNKIPAALTEGSGIFACFKGVENEVLLRRSFGNALAKAHILILLNEIQRLLPRSGEPSLGESDRVGAVKAYINSHLCENLSLEAIAESTFTDKYYLCHIFRRETGFTV